MRVDLDDHSIHSLIKKLSVIVDVEKVSIEDSHSFLLDGAIHREEG